LPGPTLAAARVIVSEPMSDERAEQAEQEEQEGLQMSFLDHLDELRRRLVYSVLAIAAAFIVCFGFSDDIFRFLQVPVNQQLHKLEVARRAKIGNPEWGQLKEGELALYTITQHASVAQVPIPLGTTIRVKIVRAPDDKLAPALAEDWVVGKTTNRAGTLLREVLDQGTAAAFDDNAQLIITTVGGAFTLYMQVALYAAIAFAVPFLFYQIWAFISPGLYQHEKRYVIPFIMMASVFFLLGTTFAYNIAFPAACDYLLGLQEAGGFRTLINAGDYFDLIIIIMLGLGIVFQIPTIAFLLGRIGLVTPRLLWRAWRYAVVVIAIIAAVLTPTADAFNMLLFAGPMLALYFLSIGVVWLFGKPRRSDSEVTALAHGK
jgi:sec-independent protein translocase protein TatC